MQSKACKSKLLSIFQSKYQSWKHGKSVTYRNYYFLDLVKIQKIQVIFYVF